MGQDAQQAGNASTSDRDNPRFVNLEMLGSGAFGFVRLVQDVQTKKLFAMKCLQMKQMNKYLEAEIVNHSLLRHPHVVQFREVNLTREPICIAMEHANKTKSKSDVRSAAKSQVGTLSYMAPEVVKSYKKYDAKVADLWSAGVVLYIMLYGKYPYDLDDNVDIPESHKSLQMLERMENEKYVLTSSVLLSLECTDLLRRLLKPDPVKRISLDEVLAHPWFTKKLPPQACEMNDYYLSLPMPKEHQSPEQIRALLDKARKDQEAQNPLN
eukprot:gene2768-12643_t